MKKTFIYNSENDIFPDYDEELEKNLFKLKDRFGLDISFLYSEGLSITYDSDKYILESGKFDSMVVIRDNKTGDILYYLINYFDRISLVLGNSTELVKLKIYNVVS